MDLINSLKAGNSLESACRSLIHSDEFQSKILQQLIPAASLPDLTRMMPHYYTQEGDSIVFRANKDDDFFLLERLFGRYRYYDSPGVWGFRIDSDKKAIAAIVCGLGARSCIEIGCFTGPILSLLERKGLDVAGIDASHLAFAFVYHNIRDRLTFGDLLSVTIERTYDVVLAMDILEHLNPAKLGDYIDKLSSLVSRDGYVLVNSPMYGTDEVFGSVFASYLREWQSVGDSHFWRHLDCDRLGWPKHGHLVWASPKWWERMFSARGLVRNKTIEAAIQSRLEEFFLAAPGRRCLFVLMPRTNQRRSLDVVENVLSAIDGVAELSRNLPPSVRRIYTAH
jgi:hypothetical protein